MDVPEQSPPTDSSGDSGPSSDWAELTHECLINILSRLTLEQLWTGPMLVCKSWLRACKDPCLHSTFDLETHFASSPESIRWCSPEFKRRVDSIINLVAKRCPNLQILSMKSCQNVTDASLAIIASRCTNLRELDISYCDEVSRESLVLVGTNCPNLKVLKRNLVRWLPRTRHAAVVPNGDSEAEAIGEFMPRLEHLEMRFSKLTAKGLTSICEGCIDLVYLDLSGCANLTSRDVANATSNLKNLKDIIKLNFCIPRSFSFQRGMDDERFQMDFFESERASQK